MIGLLFSSPSLQSWHREGEPSSSYRAHATLLRQTALVCAAAILPGLLGCHSGHTVSLSWNPSTSVVVGYNVYRGTHAGGPYKRLNSSPLAATAFTDSTVDPGQIYFYVVKSVDLKNVESVPSGEVSTAVPANTSFRISELIQKLGPKKLQSGYQQPR
jgi:hypothetical protein